MRKSQICLIFSEATLFKPMTDGDSSLSETDSLLHVEDYYTSYYVRATEHNVCHYLSSPL